MVRNHQYGYPYLNFLFLLKISGNLDFFWVKLIAQYIPDGKGRGIARDILKKNAFLKL